MTKNRDSKRGTLAAMAAFSIITAGSIFLLVGCAGPAHSDTPPGPVLQQVYKTLDDGRQVSCLYVEGHVGGSSIGTTPALSCDFARAQPK